MIFVDRLFPGRLANLGHRPNPIAWPGPIDCGRHYGTRCRSRSSRGNLAAIQRSRGLPRIEPNSRSGLCRGYMGRRAA